MRPFSAVSHLQAGSRRHGDPGAVCRRGQVLHRVAAATEGRPDHPGELPQPDHPGHHPAPGQDHPQRPLELVSCPAHSNRI